MQAVAERNWNAICQALKENGLNEIHLDLFNENWGKYSSDYSNNMRERPVAINGELKEFNWSISIPLESSKLPLKSNNMLLFKEIFYFTIFQFTIGFFL